MPSTCSENIPCGVEVSIGSRRSGSECFAEVFNDVKQVADRSSQAIDDEHVAGTEIF